MVEHPESIGSNPAKSSTVAMGIIRISFVFIFIFIPKLAVANHRFLRQHFERTCIEPHDEAVRLKVRIHPANRWFASFLIHLTRIISDNAINSQRCIVLNAINRINRPYINS